ncbi:MAG: TIR domain-containing protein [Deltaproteobacteria bacterium]
MQENTGYTYDAFMSYRHAIPDKDLAGQMHAMLENYRLPFSLRRYRDIRKGLLFMDKAELPVSEDLRRDIEMALDASRYLIVVCSPRTPGSDWIDWEIDHFLETNSPEKIIILLIDGDLETSLPEPLKFFMIGTENEAGSWSIEGPRPLLVDMRSGSPKEQRRVMRQAALSVIAAFVNCDPSEIEKADRRRSIARNSLIVAGVAALFVLFGFFSLQQMRYAKEQEQIARNAEASTLRYIEFLTYDVQDQLAGIPGTISIRSRMTEKNIQLLNEIMQLDSASPEADRERSSILGRSGDLWQTMGKVDKACIAYEQALSLDLKLEKDKNNKYHTPRDTVIGYNHLAEIRMAQGKVDQAKEAIRESLRRARKLAKSKPGQGSQEDLAFVLEKTGWICQSSGDWTEAQNALEEAGEIRRKIADQQDTAAAWEALLGTNESLGQLYFSIGSYSKAQKLFHEDLALATRKLDMNELSTQWALWNLNSNLATVSMDSEDLAGEKRAVGEMLAWSKRMAQDYEDKQAQGILGLSYTTLGNLYQSRGDYDSAQKSYEQAKACLQPLVSKTYNRDVQLSMLMLHGFMCDMAYKQGDNIRAQAEFAQKQAIINGLPDINSDYSAAWEMANLYYQKGTLSLSQNKKSQALGDYQQSEKAFTKIAKGQKGVSSEQTKCAACCVRAWINILNNKPEQALREAQNGVAYDPYDRFTIVRVKMAHAYLLSNQREKALQMYKKYRDQRVNNYTFFADQVLQDFKDLRKVGITHPDMEIVEAMMRPASGGRLLANAEQKAAK